MERHSCSMPCLTKAWTRTLPDVAVVPNLTFEQGMSHVYAGPLGSAFKGCELTDKSDGSFGHVFTVTEP